MELIQILPSIFAVFSFIFMNRSKIYGKLSKSKVGLGVMSPIMVPYVIYGLIKLARDKDFLALMERIQSQKKITDYF